MTTILNPPRAETDLKRKIVIVTDAWHPQVNGVVRTIEATKCALSDLGHDVEIMNPSAFLTFPCPTYPDIRFAVDVWPRVGRMIRNMRPDSILIATEGPLGLAARNFCISEGLHFSTNFSTKFPEYIRLRAPIPESWSYKYFQWFHNPSDSVLVATHSLEIHLHERGIKNTDWWSLGVDTNLFKPHKQSNIPDLPRPILLYVGRIAVEKNLKSFLDVNMPGTKVLVGDGPALEELRAQYPDAVFVGEKHGEELARYYSSGDVLVFPSKTDTFGLVMLEALACGTPIAAYPVSGPADVIQDPRVGVLDDVLHNAILSALNLVSQDCRNYALKFSWANCAQSLLRNLANNRNHWDGLPV